MVIEPSARWGEFGEKPDFAGLLSFAGLPYTEDPAGLVGVDVAILGAPMDELVSDRPGARLGPRAIRAASCSAGQHLAAGIDPFQDLAVVDYGDAAVVPADPRRSHAAIEQAVAEILDAGTLPIVLGGDHSITEASLKAASTAHGPLGLVHLDAHTDTDSRVFGVSLSHGTPMRRAIDAGYVDPRRYVQFGLRGYWPPPEVFEWQAERGITWYLMDEVRDRGMVSIVDQAIEQIGPGPVFVSIDIDVLDPAFAPGTGTPEPGGLHPGELMAGTRAIGAGVDVVGADLVEVAPQHIGSTDLTALVADRTVRELLVGVASSGF